MILACSKWTKWEGAFLFVVHHSLFSTLLEVDGTRRVLFALVFCKLYLYCPVTWKVLFYLWWFFLSSAVLWKWLEVERCHLHLFSASCISLAWILCWLIIFTLFFLCSWPFLFVDCKVVFWLTAFAFSFVLCCIIAVNNWAKRMVSLWWPEVDGMDKHGVTYACFEFISLILDLLRSIYFGCLSLSYVLLVCLLKYCFCILVCSRFVLWQTIVGQGIIYSGCMCLFLFNGVLKV